MILHTSRNSTVLMKFFIQNLINLKVLIIINAAIIIIDFTGIA